MLVAERLVEVGLEVTIFNAYVVLEIGLLLMVVVDTLSDLKQFAVGD